MSGMRFFFCIVCLGAALLALLSGCRKLESNPFVPEPPERGHLLYSHADSVEAGEFAVWLSGSLRAPEGLISALLYNLNDLRFVFGDSIRYHDSIRVLTARRFLAPWKVSQLGVRFDSATAQKVGQGQYRGWDSLDDYLRPDSVGRVYQDGWASIRFKPNLHPRRLAELYRTLSGVIDAEPNYIGFIEWVTFPIFPRINGKNLSYLFTLGSGSGPVWYFEYVEDVPSYLGRKNPTEADPPWWPEAMLNTANFSSWDGIK